MKWDTALRAIGVMALVAAYGVYRFSTGDMSMVAFMGIVTAILLVVAPEAVDKFPWGPSKN
jgi:hypothetical protein